MNHATTILPVDTPARIAILGAGPLALEAALYARFLGYAVDLYTDQGVADACATWPFATPLGSYRDQCSSLGIAALRAQSDDDPFPDAEVPTTPNLLCARYFEPLAQSDLLSDSIHVGTHVERIDVLLPSLHDRSLAANRDQSADSGDDSAEIDDDGHESATEDTIDDDLDDQADDAEESPSHFDLYVRDDHGQRVAHAAVIIDARHGQTSPAIASPTCDQASPNDAILFPHYYRLTTASEQQAISTLAQGRDEIRRLFAAIADRKDLDLYARLATLAQ